MKSHTRKRLPHSLKSVKRKQLKQRGGLRSLFRRKSSKLKDLIMGKISANTRHSEVDLLDAYDKFSKAKSKYLQRYQEHRENLKIFDTKLGSGTSFIKFFDERIMPADLLSGDPVDRKNPLLINDYFIYNDSTLKNLKIEHIKQQIRYAYYKNFDKQKEKLLKDMTISEVSSSAVKIIFIGKNDKMYTRDCPADHYILDSAKLLEIIPDISEKIKTNASEFVSDASKFEAKQKAEAEVKAAKEAEAARLADEQMRIAQAQAEMQRFKPRGDAQQARDFGAAAAAAIAAKPAGDVAAMAPLLPKLDVNIGAPQEDESLKALLAGKK